MKIERHKFEEEIARFMGMDVQYIYGILSVVSCVAIQDNYHGVGDYIKKINSDGLISLGNYRGGGWMTVWPISSKEYRAKYPTKAKVEYLQTKSFNEATHIAFLFSGDGGMPCAVVRKYALTSNSRDCDPIMRLIEEIDKQAL